MSPAQLILAVITIVYVITSWQRKRCDNNVNQYNNRYTDHETRIRVLEQMAGIETKKKSCTTSCSLARADES